MMEGTASYKLLGKGTQQGEVLLGLGMERDEQGGKRFFVFGKGWQKTGTQAG